MNTDQAGRFRWDVLPPGRYHVSTMHGALLSSEYGATRPEQMGTPIVLLDTDRLDNILVTMFPGGVISGRVWSARSEPLARATVAAMRERHIGPLRQAWVSEGQTTTDAGGLYRIFRLPPGDYIIAALPSGPGINAREVRRVVAPSFVPGTDRIQDADRITIAGGDERRDVDLRLPPFLTTTVHGSVVPPPGVDPGGLMARAILTPRERPLISGSRWIVNATDGSFTIPDVPVGLYQLSVLAGSQAASPEAGPWWGRTDVDIWPKPSTSTQAVVVSLQRTALVSGIVRFSGTKGRPLPDPATATVTLASAGAADESSAVRFEGRVTAAGSFAISGVPVGRYRISARLVGPNPAVNHWAVRAIARGANLIEAHLFDVGPQGAKDLIVTFSNDLASLSGSLLTSNGNPAPGFFVVLVATDRRDPARSQLAHATRSAADGSYEFMGLVEGGYAMLVLDDLASDDLQNASAVDRFAALARMHVTLGKGQEKRQDLVLR